MLLRWLRVMSLCLMLTLISISATRAASADAGGAAKLCPPLNGIWWAGKAVHTTRTEAHKGYPGLMGMRVYSAQDFHLKHVFSQSYSDVVVELTDYTNNLVTNIGSRGPSQNIHGRFDYKDGPNPAETLHVDIRFYAVPPCQDGDKTCTATEKACAHEAQLILYRDLASGPQQELYRETYRIVLANFF